MMSTSTNNHIRIVVVGNCARMKLRQSFDKQRPMAQKTAPTDIPKTAEPQDLPPADIPNDKVTGASKSHKPQAKK
jgi:hypothetical protein